MTKLNKKIENQISKSKSWTIAIGDDKVLLPNGGWGTTQDYKNFYSSATIEDAMSEKEARDLAEKTNVEENLGYFDSDGTYKSYKKLNSYYVIQIGKIKFDLRNL